MLPHGDIGEKKLQALINAPSGSAPLISATKYKRMFSLDADTDVRICAEKCRKYIRNSTYPAVVVLCYMYLLGVELGNIIKIVEGIRYSMPQETLLAMIITEG